MSEPQLPQSLLRVLASLTEWFKDQHVSYAIIGGAAIGFLAQPRATQDIDAVTWLDLAETAGFVKSGARFGFFPRISDPIEFALKSRVLLLQHNQTKIDVDISLGALPFEREMIERAIEFTTPELSVQIATPEDLIITKAVAHRKRDLLDIDNIVSVYPNLDLARIRHWVGQFAAALESPELVSDLENLLENRH
jgi:predicted nucleotidyltransferase